MVGALIETGVEAYSSLLLDFLLDSRLDAWHIQTS